MWNVGDKHTHTHTFWNVMFECEKWVPKSVTWTIPWGCQEVAKMILVHVVSILNCRFEGFKTMFLKGFIIFF